jgi:hypothetical protein
MPEQFTQSAMNAIESEAIRRFLDAARRHFGSPAI